MKDLTVSVIDRQNILNNKIMEKKQTAVEWLENQLKERYSLMNSEPLFEQAKAMHKEEVQYAYWEGGMDKPKGSKECEQYYNETFGGNNE